MLDILDLNKIIVKCVKLFVYEKLFCFIDLPFTSLYS